MEPADTATEIESENTESDSSGSDDEGTNDVIKLLDSRLLLVLNGHLDLAARLLPEIHDLLDDDDELGEFIHANLEHQKGIIHSKGQGLAGHQAASGGSSSSPRAITQVLAPRYRNVLMVPEAQKETGRVTVLREPDGSLIGTQAMLQVDCRMVAQWRIGVVRLVETLQVVTVGRALEIEEGILTIQVAIPETIQALLRSLVTLLILHAISTS
jgi:hypothetical protein